MVPLILSFARPMCSPLIPCKSKYLNSLAKTVLCLQQIPCMKQEMQPALLVNVEGTSGGKLKWKSKVWIPESRQLSENQAICSCQKPLKHLGCLYLPETLTFLPEIKVMLPYLTLPAGISHCEILWVNCALPLQVSCWMFGQSRLENCLSAHPDSQSWTCSF